MPDQARTLSGAVPMTDDDRKLIAAIQTLLGREVESSPLRRRCGMASAWIRMHWSNSPCSCTRCTAWT